TQYTRRFFSSSRKSSCGWRALIALPLAHHCYAYRRFSAARQARSTLFRQARRPAYKTLLDRRMLRCHPQSRVTGTFYHRRKFRNTGILPVRRGDILSAVSNAVGVSHVSGSGECNCAGCIDSGSRARPRGGLQGPCSDTFFTFLMPVTILPTS